METNPSKSRYSIYRLFIISLIASFIFIQCDKEDPKPDPIIESPADPNTEYMTYDDGNGEVGKAGGKVTITDTNSSITGASVLIPEGALTEIKNIKISQSKIEIYEDSVIDAIKFDPSGLVFNTPVEITLPYNSNKDSISVGN